MAIQLIHIARQNKNLYKDSEFEFLKRLKHYCKFNSIMLLPIKKAKSLSRDELLKLEAQMVLTKIKKGSYIVLLDEKGKQFASREFSSYLQKRMNNYPEIVFVIGGAYGFSELIRQQSNDSISLSKMTFSHHLARVIFLEQLYRAFSIINNEPYHND